ncbi:MAG: hypothetical protein JWL75_771 [Parcubacteria group bacterium]|nr:hypothetical protein [Parcubacteria group bacterium]
MDNPDRITYFAATDSRGKRIPFGLKAKDRQRHMYVIGKTGMGKSTILENMAIQDIQNGEGLAFIDPHGSAVETLLNYIPEHRINDVVYFAPFDLENPIAFNVMEDVGYDKRHLVVSGLMATFKKIWEDAWSARMEYILTNTLLALLEYPDATLLGVNRMYSDKAYRTKVVDNIKDPVVKSFWVDEYAKYTDKFAAEATPAIQNKIGQFTGNPLIRNIIGQPKSSFDIRNLMDNKKILLINLSKGLVGDTNMRLLGSMLTTRIFLGAMSRADLAPEQLKQAKNFYFYVDEFQNFANDTFAEILSEARKYSLNLIIAHQYVEQMEEQVRAAVFGNVGTTVSYRVGPLDGEFLEPIFSPEFLKEDLVNLGLYQMYLTLMIDGVGSRPFSAVGIPPIQPPARSFREEVLANSRKLFGAPRARIEEAVLAELTSAASAPAEPPKKAAPRPDAPRSSAPRPASGNSGSQAPRSSAPRSEQRTDALRPPRQDDRPRQQSGDRNANRPPQRSEQAERSERTSRADGNSDSERERPDPAQNSKTADDLKAILRTMTAGKQKEEQKKEEQKVAEKVPLKGALADVLTRAEGNSERGSQPAPQPRPRQQESSAPTPSQDSAPTTPTPSAGKPYEVPEQTLRSIFNETL